MGILVASVRGAFVARVSGLDLSRLLDDGAFAQVRDAFHHYAVLVFPEQRISDDQQITFSERFGPLSGGCRLGEGMPPLPGGDHRGRRSAP